MKENNNKEANSIIDDNTLTSIKTDIEYVLENVACLGRDAYGAYNEKMRDLIVLSVRKCLMEERIRTMQSERTSTIESIIDIAEKAKQADLSIDAVISALKLLK